MSNNKTQAITHFNDAGKLYNIKLYDEALELYKKAIEVDMTFADAHFCLAKTHIRKKEYDNGISHFDKFYHLITESKQGTYILALSNILIEENQSDKALKLTEDLDVQFSEQQVFDYVPLLFTNNRENQAIHAILQLNDSNIVSKGYKQLLGNESLGESLIEKLTTDNIVPRFYASKNRLQKLSAAGIQHKEYASQIKEAQRVLENIREDKNCNYLNRISEVESLVLNSQDILAKQTGTVLKTNNLEYGKKLIGILEATKFPNEKLLPIKQSLKEKESTKKKKNTKIVIISIVSVIAISIASYFGYNTYQKSKAYDRALKSNSISGYTSYLNKYGNDEKLHELREEKLYQKAIFTNNGNDINELSRSYPQSNKLRTIKITADNTPDDIHCYGIGDGNNKINRSTSDFNIRVPIGCKIRYRINRNGKIPIEKYFTVSEDLTINETTTSRKKLIFKDGFAANQNNWTTFNESKKVWGSTKQKGIKLINNGLNLYNGYRDNQFVYTTIPLSKLSKNIDFEITATIGRNKYDNGTYILFGGSKRAFNYIGIKKMYGSFHYGYNNWDNKSENWVNITNWTSGNGMSKADYAHHTITIKKTNDFIDFEINENIVGGMNLKKWYGNRIGFGVNDNTNSTITSIEIYEILKRTNTSFEKGKTYFCWVEELNVRADGTRKGKIITTIKSSDPVKLTGNIGEKKINATFKGIFSPDYYYEVELVDGTIGWVHGGALKALPVSKPINFELYKT